MKNLSRFLGRLLALPAKEQTRLGTLANNTHSSLLRKFINYGRKTFYNIGPWAQPKHFQATFFNICSLSVKVAGFVPSVSRFPLCYLGTTRSSPKTSFFIFSSVQVAGFVLRISSKLVYHCSNWAHPEHFQEIFSTFPLSQ